MQALTSGYELIFDLPDLSLRPAAITGRIHDDGMICASSAFLARDKFQDIIDDEADMTVFQV